MSSKTSRLRIVQPRWDSVNQRWQMPGEIVEVPEAEVLLHYGYHAEILDAPAPVASPVDRVMRAFRTKGR